MRHLIGRLLRRSGGPAALKAGAAMRRRRRLPFGRRGSLWLGLAVLAVLATAGVYNLGRTGELGAMTAQLSARLIDESARLGLRIAEVEVEGRAMTGADSILRAVGAQRGTPILAISAAQAKTELEALPWVRSAAVERKV